MEFLHYDVGVYFDREVVMALNYFSDRCNVPILSTINKGKKQTRLLKKLDNIAWDMASSRFIEKIFSQGVQEGYFIPYFLTFDKNLRELYSLYRVKGAVFDRTSGTLISFPEINSGTLLAQYGCDKVMEKFFSDEFKSKRSKSKRLEHPELLKKIYVEYRSLRKHLRN